jgi:hypothetical protein
MPEGCPDIQVLNRLWRGLLRPKGKSECPSTWTIAHKCRQRLERAFRG